MSGVDQRPPVLYVIACGGRPAADLPQFVTHAQDSGWSVCVIAAPSAEKFLDAHKRSEMTGYPVRSGYKRPEEPDVLPPADAMVVAPATFNTVNKWAAGISDTLALGLLNESIGLGLPVVVARGRALHWPGIPPSVEALPNCGDVACACSSTLDGSPTPTRGPLEPQRSPGVSFGSRWPTFESVSGSPRNRAGGPAQSGVGALSSRCTAGTTRRR
jgi:hypothetical protein